MTLFRASVLGLACLLAACCGDDTSNPNLECDATTSVVDGQQPDSTTPIDAGADAPVCGCPTLQPGDLFSVCGQTAILHYIIDPQGEAMYFPFGMSKDVFASWRTNEEGVISISQSCFDGLWVPMRYPGGVNFRPGTYVVKRAGNFPQQYVILPDNTLQPISEQVVAELCVPAYVGGVGCDPVEIPDVFWPSFIHRVDPMTEARIYPGLLFVIANNETIYYADKDRVYREVTSTAFELNHFQRQFVRRVQWPTINGMTLGAPIRIYERLISDPAQGG